MKIAVVTQGYGGIGGVQSIVEWLVQGLGSRGYSIDVHSLAASSRDAHSRRVLAPSSWGKTIRPSPLGSRARAFHWGANWTEFESQRYRQRRELTAALDNYDIVQVVAGAPMLANAVTDTLTPKVLQVATSVTWERQTQIGKMPLAQRVVKSASLSGMHRLEVKALRSMNCVLVENREMKQWVSAQGQARVVLAPPGIDTALFKPRSPWSDDAPVIAFGRLSDPRKDWPTALQAFERFIDDTQRKNRLILAGTGPLSRSLETRLKRSPVRDRIEILLNVRSDALPGLLASGSAFLQSSLEEGLGLAGLEAMACGLPVVSTETSGSREYVVNGENGYLVPLDAHASLGLAAGLERVLGSGRGPEMSATARATCLSRYSTTQAINQFASVYQSLLIGTP